MCTHRHRIGDFLKIVEISGLGPLRSGGIVPVGCTYWGAHHGGFVAPDLSYNIFRSQLLTPITSKVMLKDSFLSKISINFQISFIYIYIYETKSLCQHQFLHIFGGFL